MTSTAPGAHPPPEEVDALLDPSGGDAHVGAHVAVCDHCRQVREDLLRVRALLGDQARALPPEPPDLGARIAAALAAEPPLAPTSPRLETGSTSVVSLEERRRRPWTTWLAAAASVAVIGAGGTFLVGQLGGGGSDAAGSSAEAPAMAPQDSSGGAGSLPEKAPAAEATGGGTTTTARDGALRSSGTAYDQDDLVSQAQALLATADTVGPLSEPLGTDDASSESLLDACLVAVGRPGAEPVVTDLATFEGRDAAVVVLPDGDGYEVLVVPAGCGAGEDSVLASARLR